MDRNLRSLVMSILVHIVALRKESVDRNQAADISANRETVALRKESVDRNRLVAGSLITLGGSLSARRAWIEIARPTTKTPDQYRRSPQGERG